jgi:hypothetical protein
LTPKGYYFGCRSASELGHYWFDETMHMRLRYPPEGFPWPRWDAALNPSTREGEAALHQRGGWTAVSWEDRSADKRPQSNIIFAYPAVMNYDEIILASRKSFPHIWERIGYTVYLSDAKS